MSSKNVVEYLFNELVGTDGKIDLNDIGAPGVDYRLFGVPIQAYINAVNALKKIKAGDVETVLNATDVVENIVETALERSAVDVEVENKEATTQPVEAPVGCLFFGSPIKFGKLSKKMFSLIFNNYTVAQYEATKFVIRNKKQVPDGLYSKEYLATFYGTNEHFDIAFKCADVYRDNRHSTDKNFVRYYDPKGSDGFLNYTELVDFLFLLKSLNTVKW